MSESETLRWMVFKGLSGEDGNLDDAVKLDEFETEDEAKSYAELLQAAGETELIIAEVGLVREEELVYIIDVEFNDSGEPISGAKVLGPLTAEDAQDWVDEHTPETGHRFGFTTQSNYEQAIENGMEDG